MGVVREEESRAQIFLPLIIHKLHCQIVLYQDTKKKDIFRFPSASYGGNENDNVSRLGLQDASLLYFAAFVAASRSSLQRGFSNLDFDILFRNAFEYLRPVWFRREYSARHSGPQVTMLRDGLHLKSRPHITHFLITGDLSPRIPAHRRWPVHF